MFKKLAYPPSKSGGGKLKAVCTEGDKGIPSGGKMPGKASIARKKGIDTPMTQGDKGMSTGGKLPKRKSPLD